jgi:biotin operon repressor
MRNETTYLNRLESFQNYFKHYPKSKLKDLCEYFTEMPYGTISATLSFMYQSGHLTKNDKSEYSLPAVISTARQIAVDIAKMQKAKKILNQSKETNQQLGFFLTPKLSSTQKRIDEAISLLKSHGYKILAKKTEYAEI